MWSFAVLIVDNNCCHLRRICCLYLLVAKSLLAAGKMEFGSTILTVVAPPSNYIDDDDDDNDDAGTEGGRNAVRVSSIPRSMSLQMLKTFLESDKVGAGPISDIDYHDGEDTAIVCFQQADGNAHVYLLIITSQSK